jgi:tetratricopeptide (TPR) repeat protein
MLVAEAFVSGSLGQAVFRDDDTLRILDAPDAEPRDALPNEIYWFRHAAREVAPAHPEGFAVPIETVRARLDEEIRFFSGLDGLLVGMDRDFSLLTRRRAIVRAEAVMSVDDLIARRIRERFLIPANSQEWDPAGGLALALEGGAEAATNCYRPLARGIIDRLCEELASVVLEKLGSGLGAAQTREAIVRSGILAELALIEVQADRAAPSRLLFRRFEFPQLQAADPSGQILTTLLRNIEKRVHVPTTSELADHAAKQDGEAEETEGSGPSDPIIAAVERAVAHYEHERGRAQKGSFEDLPGIQRQVAWIGDRLKGGETARAEKAVVDLIDRQRERSRREDIVKTLTAVADLGRAARLFDWTWRLLTAVDQLGVADATALNVRAETLRDLGRYEEALTTFQETMRRFPDDEVAPNAYAHLLAELGRLPEVEARLAPAAQRLRNGGDWIAAHILAMARLRAGHTKEALAELERGAQFCPFPERRKYFITALPLALLADQRAAEAARQLETIAKDPTLSRVNAANIVLFQAHALAESGQNQHAQTHVESAQIIDFATARQKQLAYALIERYGLAGGPPAAGASAQQLSEDIAALEFELVGPKLRRSLWSHRRAA